MPQQFDEVSWHVESYLITTNIAINFFIVFLNVVYFYKCTVVFSDKKIFFCLTI